MKPTAIVPAREYNVLNLGAGVQSSALYLMFMRGELRELDGATGEPLKLDAAIFADTGDEPEAVYKHLAWLESLGGPRIIRCTAGRLGDDLIHGRNTAGKRFSAIPAFTTMDGVNRGKTKRQCTKEYKIEPIGRAMRRDLLGLAPRCRPRRGVMIVQHIGISLDEAGRAARLSKQPCQRYITRRFPLIERFITRAQCLSYLADKCPHPVPRSACVFCPMHNDNEWIAIKANPVDWQRAVEVDEALRTSGAVANRDMRQTMYLHSSLRPLVQIEFCATVDPRELQMPMNYNAECLGVCGV